MGLLLGNVFTAEEASRLAGIDFVGNSKEPGFVSIIWGLSIQIRSDRRKDRVEISSDQLINCMEEAEQFSGVLNRKTRVIGWYHSHPHITVLPSHVDVRTQHGWQAMEQHFIGLIFACFLKEKKVQGGDRLQLIAFQSVDCESSHMPVPEAQKKAYEATGERFQRKEIPITVVPLHSLNFEPFQIKAITISSLRNLENLKKTFLNEERQAYYQNTLGFSPESAGVMEGEHSVDNQEGKNKKRKIPHPILMGYNSSIYNLKICKLLEYECFPFLTETQTRHDEEQRRIKVLQKIQQRQEQKLEALKRGTKEALIQLKTEDTK